MEYKAYISRISDDLTIRKKKYEKTKKTILEANKRSDLIKKSSYLISSKWKKKSDRRKIETHVKYVQTTKKI